MKKINRLRYTGVIAGVGLAAVLFSSGVYANTSAKETRTEKETEHEVIPMDWLEAPAQEESDPAPVQDDELSAGAGSVLAQADVENDDGIVAQDTTAAVENDDGIAAQDTTAAAASAGREAQAQMPAEPETHWGYTNLGIAHVD
ncbi:MAG: hypothetical protein K2P63_05930, partial [Lachnospiraceae bacterium]|nr:hypothetical protein [Lachnospiraceae bacterium]